MTSRRLHPHQPDSFAFTPENEAWAQGQIGKFPEGRQASAVIPLLFRAQEQEGWVSKPAIETVARMLDMPEIRVLEVATFYFMFKLAPVGRVAHIEVCGTTPCMLCGSEALIEAARERIAPKPHQISEDGKFSWEEVECLGACSNAPMVQIAADYYEDLDADSFRALIDGFDAWSDGKGAKPAPGSRKGRFASEPANDQTSLTHVGRTHDENMSVALATGVQPAPRLIPGGSRAAVAPSAPTSAPAPAPASAPVPTPADGPAPAEAAAPAAASDAIDLDAPATEADRPTVIDRPEDGGDDLKKIRGVGPQLEGLLHNLGFYTFEQIGAWTPDNIRWVDQNLSGFRGRIIRDDWVAQAQALAAAKRASG